MDIRSRKRYLFNTLYLASSRLIVAWFFFGFLFYK